MGALMAATRWIRNVLSLSMAAVLTAMLATRSRAEIAPPRLDHTAIPTAQSVTLTLDPVKAAYSGEVRISLDVRETTSELRFHARALTIDTATLSGARGEAKVSGIERLETDQARVRFAAPLAPGAYTLTMRFHNLYDTQAVALYKVVAGAHNYLFTQFEDTEAREAFPCWDEPEFKIPWKVTLSVPATDLAVSNMPIAKETRAGVMKTVQFETSPPMPSYLVAICVGPFDTVPIEGMSVPGRVITVRGSSTMAAEAAAAAPAIMHSLEQYFGRPYPYPKLDLIAAPEFQYGAMENAGAIVFAERALLIDPRSVSPDQRRTVISITAHEMAHQWFGDLVTMKWWDDLWQNESFASWMATKVMDDIHSEVRDGVVRMSSADRAFTTDSRLSTRAMREKIVGNTSLGQTANELTYNKGEAVLTMFEGWLGVDKFRTGVLEYLKAFEWKNAEGSDLWRSLGRQSGEDIDAAMSTFLDQPGVPLVTLEPAGGGKVKLSQKRFLTMGEAPGAPQRWRVPVILRYPAGAELRTLRVWLTGADTVADLGVAAMPAWVMPNAGGSGYYRWRVPDAMLNTLAGSARAQLGEKERIDVIQNLSADLRAGLLSGDRYLTLLAELANDPEPEVIGVAAEALNVNQVPLTTPASQNYVAAYVRVTFDPALRRFGMKPRPDEAENVSLMRPTLLYLLGQAGKNMQVLAYAETLSASYRRDPSSIPPSLVEPAITLAAIRGDRVLFDEYKRRFETSRVPNERLLFLSALGWFKDPALRQAALDYALTGPLRPQEVLVIPYSMAIDRTGAGNRGGFQYPDDVVKWMTDHWDAVSSKMPPQFASRILRLAGGCSQERAQELAAFCADPRRQQIGVATSMHRLVEAIEECGGLHDREAERVARWMLQQATAP
jgi:alanyl aminopeptidase